MGLFSWIIVGLIAGWVAGVVVKGSGRGMTGDIILGIIGAIAGGFLAGALFSVPNPANGINSVTIVLAFLGAVVVVVVIRVLAGRPVV